MVNCKGTINEVNEGVYMCPDVGGNYNHRRAKYFGPYANKGVREIFEIKAIVVVEKGLKDAKIKWKNISVDDKILKNEALLKLKLWNWRIKENESVPLQVFLLENREQTNFLKNSSGGMLQSKKYFIDKAIGCKNSKDLAQKLNGDTWK